MILLFIQLIICHAFGDFVFQNDYIANRKCDSGYILFIEIIVHMLIDYCKIKDIISFRKDKLLIVHRVVEIGNDEQGVYFITKGDNNYIRDLYKIRFEDIKDVSIGVIW